MRLTVMLLGLCVSHAPVLATEVHECSGKVGIDTLFAPFDKHIKSFANGAVTLFNTDTDGEPVGCSKGVAITFPDNELPSTRCYYVGCFASISDVSDATATYSAQSGLLIEMKTGGYGDNGPMPPSKLLKIRVNRKTGKVVIER